MFASQHRLSNLYAIVDWNGQQALGLTRDVIDMSNLAERWQGFGWKVSEVDGHSVTGIVDILRTQPGSAPTVVLANTTFGKGVSYMEQGIPVSQKHLSVQPINWHYLPMSDLEFEIAMKELEGHC